MATETPGWPTQAEIDTSRRWPIEALNPEYYFVYTLQGKSLEDLAGRIHLAPPRHPKSEFEIGPTQWESHDAPFVEKYPELATERTQEGAKIALPTMKSLDNLYVNYPPEDEPDQLMLLDVLIGHALHERHSRLGSPTLVKTDLPTAAEVGEAALAFQEMYGRPWLATLEAEGVGEIATSTMHGKRTKDQRLWHGPEGRVVFSTVGDKISYRIQDNDLVNRKVGLIPIVRPI